MSKARAWCFTINNWTEADTAALKNLATEARYLVYEEEKGEEKKTPHIQGYVYLPNARSLEGMKRLLGSRAHLEVAKGTAAQNREYCTKEGTGVVEVGEMPKQGRRNDITTARDILASGGTMRDVCMEVNSYQAIRGAELLIRYCPKLAQPVDRGEQTVYWFWGPTGSGKTRTAVEMGGDDYWMSGKNLRWWDGYAGQSTVIIDDFRGDFCTFHELLRILDRYPYRVEIKGGSVPLESKTIIITSPKPPTEAYTTREDIGQLLRRIKETRYFPGTEVGGNTGTPTSP